MGCNAFNKRLAALGEIARPQLISIQVDFIMWRAEDEPDRNVEPLPQMQEFVDGTLKHRLKN